MASVNPDRPFAFAIDGSLEARLFSQLEARGLACLEDAVDRDFLKECRAQVDELLEANGYRFFSLIQPQETVGGVFAQVAQAPGFVDLLRRLASRAHSAKAADFDLYEVLRVSAGNEAAKGAFEFHYDATVLTVLMPLHIPEGQAGKAGELIALPNHRKYRRFAFINVLEKLIRQNPLAFRYYRWRYCDGGRNVVRLKPGNLYFFYGYRCLHGNLPSMAGEKRATLILHFGDPHTGDVFTRAIIAIRKLREGRRLGAA